MVLAEQICQDLVGQVMPAEQEEERDKENDVEKNEKERGKGILNTFIVLQRPIYFILHHYCI